MARALATTHTGLLALVVPDITNPVYFEIINGVQDEAAEAGYTVLLVDSRESDTREREALERALPIVDGIVLGTSRMSDAAIRMIAKQKPMVALNRAVREIPSVVPDNARGVRRALEHLGGLGHDPVTYLAGPEASWADGMRWRGLREASLELSVHVRRLGPLSPTVAGGVAGAKAWLQAPATTGVIAYNDLIAIGFIRSVAARGVRVPGDVSVVGYDNIFAADLVTPPLTTIATPRRALGAAAVRNLVAQIKGVRPRVGPPVVVPVKLVERESTGPRRYPDPPAGVLLPDRRGQLAATDCSGGASTSTMASCLHLTKTSSRFIPTGCSRRSPACARLRASSTTWSRTCRSSPRTGTSRRSGWPTTSPSRTPHRC